jgi:hypothetical protein
MYRRRKRHAHTNYVASDESVGEWYSAEGVIDVATPVIRMNAQTAAVPAGKTPSGVGWGDKADGEAGFDLAGRVVAVTEVLDGDFEVESVGGCGG